MSSECFFNPQSVAYILYHNEYDHVILRALPPSGHPTFSGNLQSCAVLWSLCGFGRWQTHLRNKDHCNGGCWTTGTATASSRFGWNQDLDDDFFWVLMNGWMVEPDFFVFFFLGGEWPWVNPTHLLQYRSDVPRSNLKNFKVTRVHNWNQKQCMGFQEEMPLVLTHRIHGTGIFTYMNGWFYMKCRQIYHTWILWVMQLQHLIFGFNSFSRSQLHGSCFYRSRLESMTWLCSSLTTWREWPR